MRRFCFSEEKVFFFFFFKCSLLNRPICTPGAWPEDQDRCPRKSVILFKSEICTRFASNSTPSTTFWAFPGWKLKYGEKAVFPRITIHHSVSIGANQMHCFVCQYLLNLKPDLGGSHTFHEFFWHSDILQLIMLSFCVMSDFLCVLACVNFQNNICSCFISTLEKEGILYGSFVY